MTTHGIKETTEALEALNEILLFFVDKFKDGVQIEDFIDFYSDVICDPKTRAVMMKAYEGYKKIPDEIKDIDVLEACALISTQINVVPKILEALRKTESTE
jgi:hypothetical protein